MSKILIIIRQKENRRLLADYLSNRYEVIDADAFGDKKSQALLSDQAFDLGIVDGPSLDQYASAIEARKTAEAPLFLPILFTTSRKDVRMVTRHLWRSVDDLIISPIEKTELQARVEVLLRARFLSLQLEKHNEETLQTSEARYRHIFETAAVAIWEEDLSEVRAALDELKARGVSDIEQYLQNNPDVLRQCAAKVKVLDVNQASLAMFEARSKTDLLTSIEKVFVPESYTAFTLALGALARGERLFETETVHQTLQGRRIDVLLSIAIPPPGSPFQNALVSLTDITARKRAEKALRKSERELRLRNEISNIFLTVSDERIYGDILAVIQRATKSKLGVFGYVDEKENLVCPSLTREVWDQCQVPDKDIIFPKEKWSGIWGRAILEKKTLWSNEPFRTPEGLLPITRAIAVPILYGGEVIGNIVVANKEMPYDEEDVKLVETIANHIAPILSARLQRDKEQREKEKLQELFYQSQKLESVARLAGGVAHDFNNMLSIILGYGENILEQLHREDPLWEDAKQIVEAGKRSADLTRQLLAFSRKQTLQPKVLNLNDVIRNIEKMLRRLIGEDIELELSLSRDLSHVKVDPGQIEQVIMNLAVNARDAMPTGGKLHIETSEVVLDDAYAQHHPGVSPGKYAMLAISDTGCGMDKEVLSQIFDPFFTTKEKGKGTGLGLATVYGIVKQSGGNIWVYSEPGQGTTFKIYLPVTGVQAEALAEEAAQEEPTGGGEHILVVEDEDSLRKLMEAILSRLGYKVTLAANGGEALLLVEEKGLKPDLVITDVVMPNMSGRELTERLRRKHPDLKALFMSGYTDDSIVHHGVLDPGTPFIQKPFTPRQIAEKIRAVLRNVKE